MLKARLATAVVAVPILVALVWIGGPIFVLAASLVAAVAASEAVRLVSSRRGLADVVSVAGAFTLVLGASRGIGALLAIIAFSVLASTALALRPAAPDDAVGPPSWAAALAACLYGGLPLAILVLLRETSGPDVSLRWLALPLSRGFAWVAVTFSIVWAVDTIAYATGRSIGKRPLWLRVSAKKTWEGTIAGFLAGSLVGLAWSAPLGLSLPWGIVLGCAGAASAILGDLTESAMKRSAEVKDSGTIFPGHGGLLDRLDSLGYSLIVVFLIVQVVRG